MHFPELPRKVIQLCRQECKSFKKFFLNQLSQLKSTGKLVRIWLMR